MKKNTKISKLGILPILLLTHFSQAQNFDWARNFGGTTSDYGKAIVMDDNENVYITGTFTGAVDFDPGPGTEIKSPQGTGDIFIQKLDALGNLIWVQTIGGANAMVNSNYINIDDAGNIYIGGQLSDGPVDFDPGVGTFELTESTQFGNDGFVLKLDASGNFSWVKQFDSSNHVEVRSISMSTTGLYVCGFFEGTIDLDPNAGVENYTNQTASDGFIVNLDNDGTFNFGTTITNGYCFLENSWFDIATNSLYIIGLFNNTLDFDPGSGTNNVSATGEYDGFVLKLNQLGAFQWVKTYGGTDISVSPKDICVDNTGNVFVTGEYNKLDYTPGGSVDFNSPAGGTSVLSNLGNEESFILKIDATTGNYIWVKGFSSPQSAKITAIDIDGSGNIYTTGVFNSTLDFDPSTGGTQNLTATYYDAFILKLNTNGEFVWVNQTGGTGAFVSPNEMHVNSSGAIATTGFFFETADFDPGSGIYNLTTNGVHDIFVNKFDSNGSASLEELSSNLVEVYPNPAINHLNIVSSEVINNIDILDATGRFIKSVDQTSFFVSELTPGIYYLNIILEKGVINKRFVKE